MLRPGIRVVFIVGIPRHRLETLAFVPKPYRTVDLIRVLPPSAASVIETPCCMDQPGGRSDRGAIWVLCDADVAGASQLQHAVQDVDSNCHLGCLTLVGLRAQARDRLPVSSGAISASTKARQL